VQRGTKRAREVSRAAQMAGGRHERHHRLLLQERRGRDVHIERQAALARPQALLVAEPHLAATGTQKRSNHIFPIRGIEAHELRAASVCCDDGRAGDGTPRNEGELQNLSLFRCFLFLCRGRKGSCNKIFLVPTSAPPPSDVTMFGS
jgi:hypothetical protein